MKVLIVGGETAGEALANLLIKEKHDVVIIEKEEKRAEELAERLDAIVLHGDGSDRGILKDADVDNADAVVAMTSDDKSNLMVCEMAKSVNVPNIIARINQSSNEAIFTKVGISNIINTTTTAIMAFKRALEKPGKHLVNLVAGGKAEVFELSISENSKFAGKFVGEVSKDFIIGSIYRNGELIMPKDKIKINEGDILTVVCPLENVKKIEKML